MVDLPGAALVRVGTARAGSADNRVSVDANRVTGGGTGPVPDPTFTQ
jgi:hypothetical protein